ncbi:MAG: HAD hydrolase-like protein, partial [Oscillospiraceae bacterium]|nr:HAD hydrolase-like protein [Oscillospiraceae bacterium]
KGIKGLIFDIDNTLVTYSLPGPTLEISGLMQKLKEDGLGVCFVSNNKKERVEIFNRTFGFPAFYAAGKPKKKYMKRALEVMGTAPCNTAVIGDQLFTDICAGKRMKMLSLLVMPIEPVETLFFKLKRVLEKPLIKRYKKLQTRTTK